ncbi:MAG: putative toxin-antitoxin system toxin component, PIN family [Rudaea sp.]
MRSLRVVLDTNVVLSALLFGAGATAQLRRAWQGNSLRPLVNTATAHELIRVLAYPKFRLTANEQEDLLADYLPYATTIRKPARLPRVPSCRDPFDLPFLQLALTGKAEALVSGDKDLLALADGFLLPILTPADFLTQM